MRQLKNGNATVTVEFLADADETYEVSLIPLKAGDVATGQSGTRTRWPEAVLRDSVRRDIWQGARLVKSAGGDLPHYLLSDQLPPEAIVGRVDTAEWDRDERAP